MLALYNQVILANSTFYSPAVYIGLTNSPYPLIVNPIQAIFIKGSSTTLSVTIEGAFIPTPPNEQVTLLDTDYIEIQTITADGVINGLSLNGLWIRFKVQNTASSDAIVTAVLND